MTSADDDGPLQYDPERITGWDRTLLEAFNLWFNPEVHRRVAAGRLKIPFELKRAQVLFRGEHQAEVRFNEEVTGALEVQTAKAVTAGDPVYAADIAKIHRYEVGLADADAGHFSIFKSENDSWFMFFDFQRNKRSAADLVASAAQFATTAEFALERGLQGPFIDNLFSASVLLARARLITEADEQAVKTHKTVGSKINRWAKTGNVDARFVELFNELSRLREHARYRGASPELKADDPTGRIRAEIAALQGKLKRFSDDP